MQAPRLSQHGYGDDVIIVVVIAIVIDVIMKVIVIMVITDVTVIDYHDTDDIASALLCDESRRLELRATCSALALLSGDGDTSTKNVKTGLDLADIVAAAYARNLVGASETFAGLKAKLEPLVLGRRDLPRRCISREITHMIRELSERAEEVLVPESRASAPQRVGSNSAAGRADGVPCLLI